jgi:serine/threonine protein phosphatase PrpC
MHPHSSSDRTRSAAITAVLAEATGELEQGAETSSTATHVFLQALAMDMQSGSPALASLERALRAANAAVLQLARDRGLAGRIGATLAAIVITSEGLHWIASGSTRIYLWRRGTLHEVNVDRAVALGSHVLGPVDFSRRAVRLDHGDRLVLCGTGVYNVLSRSEIAQSIGVDGTAVGNVTALALTYDERDPSVGNGIASRARQARTSRSANLEHA